MVVLDALAIVGTSSDDEKISKLYRLLSPHIELIQKQYPKVTKNSCGYRLDAIISNEKFYPHKIFAASEGTLGIVTSAKLKIIDIPLYSATMVFGFKDLLSAMSAVPVVLQFSPVALEMLDHTVFRNLDVEASPRVMDSGIDGGSLLFVEFADDTLIHVEQRFTSCKDKLSSVSIDFRNVYLMKIAPEKYGMQEKVH